MEVSALKKSLIWQLPIWRGRLPIMWRPCEGKEKGCFVHIDYESSGYTPFMDKDCYEKMDRIFAVSDEVKAHFLKCLSTVSK